MYIYKLVPRPPTFKTGSTPLIVGDEILQNLEQNKKERIEIAEQTRQAPVDESQAVPEMSDFIDTHDTVEDGAAFEVRLSFFTLLVQVDGWRPCINMTVMMICN